jgi:transposase-like protein
VSSVSAGTSPASRSRPLALSPSLQAIDADTRYWRDGLLTQVTQAVLEAALEAELIEHLRTSQADAIARRAGGNCRNGTRSKTVRTIVGPITIDAPRDRWGTFQPVTVGKWQRRAAAIDQLVLPLAAAGVTLDDSVGLMTYAYGRTVSRRLLLGMAAAVRARMDAWHKRELRAAYACVLLDRAVVRSRSVGVMARPVHTAVGVYADGRRDLLGLWMRSADDSPAEWCAYVAGLRTRGLESVAAVVTDACAPLELALESIWPQADVHVRPRRDRMDAAPSLPASG